MAKVITTVNGFAVETYDKKNAANLADYIDQSQKWNVTEVVFSWATEQCIIRVYSADQTAGQNDLELIIKKYYELLK